MFKVNNKDIKTMSFDIILVSFLLMFSSASIADFEQVTVYW